MSRPDSPPLSGPSGWGRPLLTWRRRVHERARAVATHHASAWVVRVALGARRRWLRSLQVRVVATTMLLGTVVVFAVGSVLLAGIWKGLVDSRQDAAFTEAARLTDDAENSF